MGFPSKMTYSTYFVCAIVLSILALSYGQSECPTEGSVLLPHPNCSVYITCDNGKPVIVWCPDNLYFNPEVGICDYPQNVPECVGGTRPPESGTTTIRPTTTTTTQATTTRMTTTSATTTTTELPNGCPSAGFKLVPHPTRCEFYFACQDGNIIGFGECPEGLYFDPVTENCNFQHLVNCTNPTTTTTPPPTTTTLRTTTTTRPTTTTTRPTTTTTRPTTTTTRPTTTTTRPTTTTTRPTTTTTAPPTTTRTTTTTARTTTPAPSCPPTGIVNIPFPGNCSLYTLCLNGVPILSQCPTGTKFDLDSLQCKPLSEARCEDTYRSTELDVEIIIDHLFCPSNVGFTKMPMANDCQSWYECKNGKRISRPEKCPKGMHFYDVDQTCVTFKPEYCPQI